MEKLNLIGLAIYKFSWSWQLVTSAPLCVIDGVIADATVFSNLDPNIIKSISILKDAASSAIYGSRCSLWSCIVGQTKLSPEAFASIGADNFNTKIMVFFRKSIHYRGADIQRGGIHNGGRTGETYQRGKGDEAQAAFRPDARDKQNR